MCNNPEQMTHEDGTDRLSRNVGPETSVRNHRYSMCNNPEQMTHEDGTDRLSQNVGKKSPLLHV